MAINDGISIKIEALPIGNVQPESMKQELVDLIDQELDVVFTDRVDKNKGEPLNWNALVISLIASGGVLTTLISLLQANLTKLKQISVEIDGDKLTITNPTSEQQDLLIRDWVRRHSTKSRHPRQKK